MLEIDKRAYMLCVWVLAICATATVFGSLGIALKNGDAPISLSTLGTTLFGMLIALATQTKKN